MYLFSLDSTNSLRAYVCTVQLVLTLLLPSSDKKNESAKLCSEISSNLIKNYSTKLNNAAYLLQVLRHF
jgi:hypothetical protein